MGTPPCRRNVVVDGVSNVVPGGCGWTLTDPLDVENPSPPSMPIMGVAQYRTPTTCVATVATPLAAPVVPTGTSRVPYQPMASRPTNISWSVAPAGGGGGGMRGG